MKTLIQSISQFITIVALVSVLSVPVMMKDALAKVTCTSPQTQDTCGGVAGGECIGDDGGSGTCVPEMADYLAMAFIAVAGGIIWYYRRKTVSA